MRRVLASCAVLLLALVDAQQDRFQGLPRQEVGRISMSMLRDSYKAEAEGRLRDALQVAERMPQDGQAVFRQGKLLVMLGNFPQALLALNAVAAVHPDMPALQSYIAFAKWQTGDVAGSAEACALALNATLLDFRAVAVLRHLPAHVVEPYAHLLQRYDRAAAEAHRREGVEDPPSKTPHLSKRASQGLVLVSSANSLYFGCLVNHIASAQLREPGLKILVFDMGFDPFEQLVLQELESVELALFPFERFPAHVRNLRNYAWKPLVYMLALQRHRKIFYQDAGQELWQPLGAIDGIIERDGYFFVMQGERTLPEKIHPAMFEALNVPPEFFKGEVRASKLPCPGKCALRWFPANISLLSGKDMCAGGIQGYRNDSQAMNDVLGATVVCALDKDCIAPNGADQGNHRFDQSAFSIHMSWNAYRCHNAWLFRAYLEEHRLHEADTHDVPDGFGTVYPIIFSRRCGPPLSHYPKLRKVI